MSVLIVGAGATGGYIGAQLVAAGRDVRFLVHPRTLERLRAEGLRIQRGNEIDTVRVDAVTVAGLRGPYDLVVVAVRTDAVESAVEDMHPAVGPQTRIVPIMNGMRHLSVLTGAFGRNAVLGAETRLAISLRTDGMIEEVAPGVQMEIGQLDGGESDILHRTAELLETGSIAVTVRRDIVAAMWEKFAFITSTAVLTCLVGDEIGPIVRAAGGIALARRVLDEVVSVAAADGHTVSEAAHSGLDRQLTDPSSTFGPSMFRDLRAGRPVEIAVLRDLADRARAHQIATPLLDASLVVVDVHNRHARDVADGQHSGRGSGS
ncbi:MAG: 2-dehydropantoate 2-reductase [Mycobacterium sp.]|jgi:2-dehydropantoate 2-reductase|nr:2-dehydropantoate 2-reductase [Mycobacterium sp.]MDT5132299.1 2-dehydropantoate 2-reductase [Mycobacterium sp.]